MSGRFKRIRHTPAQIVRQPRNAEQLIIQGQTIGADRSGSVDEEEFVASHGPVFSAFQRFPDRARTFIERAAGGLFDVLDLDADGCLHLEDLEAYASAYGKPTAGIATNLARMLDGLNLSAEQPRDQLPRKVFLILLTAGAPNGAAWGRGRGVRRMISRREWLAGASGLLAAHLAEPLLARPVKADEAKASRPALATAVPDFSPRRISARMVSLRPYRPEGFRVELETIADRSVVHNIGHGGAGITLSWGTSRMAVDRLLALRQPGPVAVLGCGAVGLATAWLLHEAGRVVTIYASEVHPRVTSSVAGASFFPSLVVAGASRTPEFETGLAAAMRTSHRRFLGLLGRGMGVVRRPHVVLSAERPTDGWVSRLLPEIFPPLLEIRDPSLPFAAPWLGLEERLFIETQRYLPALMGAVRKAGMAIQRRTFRDAADLGQLRERLIVNCTGMGSAGLFGHADLIPVQGQLTRLQADSRINYTLSAPGLYLHPRRDGLLLGGTQEIGVLQPRFDPAAEERILAGMRQLYRPAA